LKHGYIVDLFNNVVCFGFSPAWMLSDELAGLVIDKHMKERVTTVTLATSPKFFASQSLLGESPNSNSVRNLNNRYCLR